MKFRANFSTFSVTSGTYSEVGIQWKSALESNVPNEKQTQLILSVLKSAFQTTKYNLNKKLKENFLLLV